jgi:peptidoglycan hydrolase CwlO-like protein
MPTIYTEQEFKIEVDFEVYCNTCGCGLCNETIVKGHQSPQVRVNVCPDCIKEKNEEIKEALRENTALEEKIESLQDQLDHLTRLLKEKEEQ